MPSYEMVPYEAPTELCADPTGLIGAFVIFLLLRITYQEVPLYAEQGDHEIPTKTEILEKELEMAHKHQEVLEEDNKNLQASIIALINSTPASNSQNLQAAITNLLQKKTGGLMCKQLLTMLIPSMPDITKKDLNTMLYKMKIKKIVKIRSNFDKVPTWLLCA